MTLLIASDHAGFRFKEDLKAAFPEFTWRDLGPSSEARVDYPDFADLLAKEVSSSDIRGVLICGSGQGMAIRANRYPEVRAALCWNVEVAALSRQHNDSNVLCLGARVTAPEINVAVFKTWLETSFEGGRHQDRVTKLGAPTGC